MSTTTRQYGNEDGDDDIVIIPQVAEGLIAHLYVIYS